MVRPSIFCFTRITNQFQDKLGQGAYGTVFKGKLSSECFVAVKEVGMMGSIHHVNVVRLVGFCADGFHRALIYEFFANVFSRNFGNVSYKSDVYSFGMLLLEMVAIPTEIYYPEWIYNLLEKGEELRIHLGEEGDGKTPKKLAIVGLWCIQWHPAGRPSMKEVVQMLEGGENLTMPPNPFASTGPTRTNATTPARNLNIQLEAITELE
ncbi:hypothetical protein D8674_042255 [Pyrus ussuriensis x Pyrus communis]|uniref:Serine-threonine/tyrosine-protein kinase catalytic domain-containing protein n=1 Tax=Pyrus ussuriensis x Pyrus communis TaxID=2448454 RepID=A0A5N5GGD6_9ROSA|nr:hypothetical protein D8674_042255 [Pyrus ussuriensis x Pyrus communis]